MIAAYKKFWQQYADFGGKSTVSDYWWVFLVNVIISAAISGFAQIIPSLSVLSYIYSLATLVPGLAIFVRRMNDCGRSWTNLFWVFLPIAGVIILIIRLCESSK